MSALTDEIAYFHQLGHNVSTVGPVFLQPHILGISAVCDVSYKTGVIQLRRPPDVGGVSPEKAALDKPAPQIALASILILFYF